MEQMIAAVIFDMDGVIFDSERLALSCWEELGERWGLEDIRDTYVLCVGVTETVSRQVFLERYGESFEYERFWREFKELARERIERDGLPVKKGARAILSALRERGVPTALASSTKSETVLREIEEAGLSGYFDAIIGGDMISRSKPEPDIFLTAAERLGVRAENCCVIEDSYNGIRAAYRAGMIPVMVPDMLPPTDEMRALAAAVLPDLNEAADLILQ